MDADNWLREIEKKLELTKLTEEECVTVAADRHSQCVVGQLL
jgi:hypothetical protein